MKLRRPDRSGQRGSLRVPLRQLATGAAIVGLAAQAWAQSPTVTVQPRLSVSQTWTDNQRLASQNKDAAVISTISPGISISGHSGRVRGSLDYALNGLIYTRSEQANRIQNALSANASIEAAENWLYVDGAASISQQTISAFGPLSADPSLRSGNTSEVVSLSVSPQARGQISGLLAYTLRGNVSEARAKDSVAGDTGSRALSLSLNGLGSGRLLNWSAAVNNQASQSRGGRDTETMSATGTLLVSPDIDWNFGVTGGYERTDYETVSARGSGTYGVNADWRATPRTKLAASWSHHEYGNAHSLSFEHRMARSVWRFSDSQSVSNVGPQGRAGVMTNYELFFIQFAAEEPDPVRRDLLVRAVLSRLGLSPDAITTTGFLSASTSLSRTQSFSFALQGLRTTMTLMVSQSKSHRIDTLTAAQDDLGESSTVLQRGISVSLAHRLTPTSSATLQLSQQQSRGDLATQSSDLKSLTANWSGRLGQKTSLQLGLRHNRFNSPQRPYRENAVLATVVQQF